MSHPYSYSVYILTDSRLFQLNSVFSPLPIAVHSPSCGGHCKTNMFKSAERDEKHDFFLSVSVENHCVCTVF